MSAVKPLDWQTLPLGDGRVLIEASAGTGKTWTIGTIFLRLLLERDFKVAQILVVTFTDAAARELRERLRMRLADAERWLRDLTAAAKLPDDPVAQWLAATYADARQAKAALRRIRIARLDFDRAPIATIHALCQRIQNDFPLQAGADFAAAKRLDENALLRECVEDFWRLRYLTGAAIDRDEAEILLDKGPEDLLFDLAALLRHDATVLPADGLESMRHEIAALRAPQAVEALSKLRDAALFRSKRSALLSRLDKIVTVLESTSNPAAELAECIDKYFGDDELDRQQPDDVAFRLRDQAVIRVLQRLRGLLPYRKVFVRGKVLEAACAYCRERLAQRAAQRQGQTFSMLIESVHARMRDGAHLADCLYAAFPAALIDEFQDTDTRQFEIFDRIYRDAQDAQRGFLALIGDPKQAIYGFRGGDIAAYLRARAVVPQRFDLTENFRSGTPLIEACNAIYGAAADVFDDAQVRYVPVQPGGKGDEKTFTRRGAPVQKPFAIHRFAQSASGNKAALEALALEDCAARIVELVNDATACIGTERVQPGDIAVLLPKNAQIGALRKSLRRRGVPCTGSGNDSVFESEAARELELILHAALHPEDDRAARGALTTTILGKRLSDVRVWQRDAAAFERELDRIAHWHGVARARGAMGVVADILDQCAADLLALPEGERILADVRHLGELLAAREGAECGLEGALAWFASMRRGELKMEASDGHRLRGETDASSVRLMTLHAAKGLEFPIVFLPLAWHIASRNGQHAPKVLRFHDARGTCVDLGSAQFAQNLARHFAEDLRERVRLLYVAITRAKYAVHMYWTDRGVASDAPLWNVAASDRLIHGAQRGLGVAGGEAALPELAQRLAGIEIAAPSPAGEMAYARAMAPQAPRAAQAPLPAVRPFVWTHSFSSITRQRVLDSFESAVTDEAASPAPPETEIADAAGESAHAELLALDVWRGKRFGIVVHGALEDAWHREITEQQLGDRLEARGVRPRGDDEDVTLAALARMLARTRATDLGDGLRLSDLSDAARVAEFGFQLPVAVSLPALRAVCAAHDAADVWPERISTPALNGMLNGFADLIFLHGGRYHVLDYKTNRLGERLRDYRESALQTAMDAHHYPLQALLYTVALHRYLRQRLPGYTPELHLGESWYLFLRGVGLAPGAGVWRRRWSAALIMALDEACAGVAT